LWTNILITNEETKMKKLALITGISSVIASPVFAAPVAYNGTAVSNGVTISSIATTNAFYADWASGDASNKTSPAVNLTAVSNWSFDFSDASDVQFSGSLQIGDYRFQQNITGLVTMDGRQTFYGVTQSFANTLPSGTKPKATFDASTRTLSYVFSNSVSDGGGASIESHTAAPTCKNGASSFLGSVCGNFVTTPGALSWEGLTLSLVFSSDLSSYTGSLTGVSTSGAGIAASTSTYKWNLSGSVVPTTPTVPVPAAAWLFGSGLLGLAGATRKRGK
jgi:hypothetical protein